MKKMKNTKPCRETIEVEKENIKMEINQWKTRSQQFIDQNEKTNGL